MMASKADLRKDTQHLKRSASTQPYNKSNKKKLIPNRALTLTNEHRSERLARYGKRHRTTEPSDVIRQGLERPEDAGDEENEQQESWRARRGKVYD